MPFIESAVKEAREAQVAPEAEYDLRINSAEITEKGTSVKCVIIIEGDENYLPIAHWLPLITKETKDDSKDFILLQQRRFLEAFGISYEDNGFDTDDFAGSTGRMMVKQEMIEEDYKTGTKLDNPFPVNRIILPRLKNEEAASEKKGGKDKAKARGRR